jgi:hypothetical protein
LLKDIDANPEKYSFWFKTILIEMERKKII